MPESELRLALAALHQGLIDAEGLAGLCYEAAATREGVVARLITRGLATPEQISALQNVAHQTIGYEDGGFAKTLANTPESPGWEAGPEEEGELGSLASLTLDDRRFGRRYHFGHELGRGGVGRVLEAEDRLMGRRVAVKALREDKKGDAYQLRRFLAEARTTAQLEHPNVIPVYDIGQLPGGEACFTMKRVGGRSMSALFKALEAGEEELVAEWDQHRLLQAFAQICMAVDYAHSKGVIHRDLKPDNVMIGDFAEVLVMDWGIAKLEGAAKVDSESAKLRLSELQGELTVDGSVVGTPGYMAPEQAAGQPIDARADVWALGAILYRMLTGQLTHRGETAFAVLVATCSADVVHPRERCPERNIPEDLADICARALCRDPEARYPSARALHDAIQRFMAGTEERERRQREADRVVSDAKESMWYLRMLSEERAELRATLAARPPLKGHEPMAEKRSRWALEDRLEELSGARSQGFGTAESRFLRALELVPRHAEACAGLGEMYWSRYREARQANELRAAREQLKLASRYLGRADPRLGQHLLVSLASAPAGAEVILHRVDQRDRVLVPAAPRSLGLTPLEGMPVPTGRHLLELRFEDRPAALLPLLGWQGDELRFEVQAPSASFLGEDFVFVPGGAYVRGNDPEAMLPAPAGLVEVAPFAIQRFPVTVQAYFDFLNALPPGQARQRAPRSMDGKLLFAPNSEGRFVVGPDPDGDLWDGAWPITCVSYADAQAYAGWRGPGHRLPSAEEWEKAARGTDGRPFPWGRHIDPSFCSMRGSVPGDPLPQPVGRFERDRSPYGVRDMAGGVREWTTEVFEAGQRTVRGGAFSLYALFCHAAGRFGAGERATLPNIGFRLVKTL